MVPAETEVAFMEGEILILPLGGLNKKSSGSEESCLCVTLTDDTLHPIVVCIFEYPGGV